MCKLRNWDVKDEKWPRKKLEKVERCQNGKEGRTSNKWQERHHWKEIIEYITFEAFVLKVFRNRCELWSKAESLQHPMLSTQFEFQRTLTNESI